MEDREESMDRDRVNVKDTFGSNVTENKAKGRYERRKSKATNHMDEKKSDANETESMNLTPAGKKKAKKREIRKKQEANLDPEQKKIKIQAKNKRKRLNKLASKVQFTSSERENGEDTKTSERVKNDENKKLTIEEIKANKKAKNREKRKRQRQEKRAAEERKES